MKTLYASHLIALAISGICLFGLSSQAAPLYWDINDTAGIQLGAGAWNTSAVNWNPAADGSGVRQAWVDNSDAFFVGTSSPVTLSAGQLATNVTISSGAPNFTGGDLTISGALSRFLSGQSELQTVTATSNSVVINNTGATGNNAVINVRTSGSLTVGPGGLNMTGIIDTAGQRTARLGFRSGAAGFAVLQGDVNVTGYAGFNNGSAFTNNVRLNGIRTFTVNAAGAGLTPTTGYLTIADVIAAGQFTSVGSVSLTDNGLTAGGIIKAGIGTMEIRSASSYTGTTTVKAGALKLSSLTSNNIPTSSAIIVGSTAAESSALLDVTGLAGSKLILASAQNLSGHGTVQGSVDAGASSTVAPGSSAGKLSIGGTFLLNPSVTSTLEIELGDNTTAGLTYDQLFASGSVTVAGARLNVIPLSGATGGMSYEIVDAAAYASAGSNFFAQLNDQPGTNVYSSGGLSYSLRYVENDGIFLDLVSIPDVPEPFGLPAIALGTFLLRRNRKGQ